MTDTEKAISVSPITPTGTIRILRNVGLDTAYKDTFTFSSVSEQQQFFAKKGKYNMTGSGPVRMQSKIRCKQNADYFYDCDYVMFQNTNFGSKWFYAFITAIDFINVNMCEISFELDVMQTFYFDYSLRQCFVEREHVNNDAIGANTVAENVELGEYVLNGSTSFGFTNMKLVTMVASSFDSSGSWSPGDMYSDVYSGLHYYKFDTTSSAGVTELNDFLKALNDAGKLDGVVSIFMMPEVFAGSALGPERIEIPKAYTNINGYVPKNNKLFTYPYNFLRVTNGQGNAAVYRYEFFATDDCKLDYYGDTSPNPSVLLYPISYKGSGIQNYEEGISITGFPQCAFTGDVFKAWLAQNGSSTAVSAIASTGAFAGSLITGNIAGATAGAIGIANVVAKITETAILPPQSHGSQSSGVQVSLGIKDFFWAQLTIRSEYAKIIDDYFSMFGYAVHQVKVPNRTGRKSWNYVKTVDCKIDGSVPFDASAKIKSIYDHGITFWHGDFIGSYNLSNPIV